MCCYNKARIMSTRSRVSTEKGSYNSVVYNMLCLLQFKVTKILKNGIYLFVLIEFFDDRLLFKYFTKFYKKMSLLEEDRQTEPLFSHSLKDLVTYFNVGDRSFNKSNSSSSEFSFAKLHTLIPYFKSSTIDPN